MTPGNILVIVLEDPNAAQEGLRRCELEDFVNNLADVLFRQGQLGLVGRAEEIVENI